MYDAIIAGAGPVGLFLACELALAGCSVLVLEKADDPQSPLKQLPFGMRGLSAPSIEALDRRGLLDELDIHKRIKQPHQHAGEGARRQVGHFAGIPFHEGDIDTACWGRLPGASATSLISAIGELETVLARRAAALGVEILRGIPVTALSQNADGVMVRAGAQADSQADLWMAARAGSQVGAQESAQMEAQADALAGTQPFHGRWLVGCDGARSAVRKLAGFGFEGTEPEFTGYTMQADIAGADQLKPGRTVTASGMYLQSQPGYLIVQDFDGGAFHSAGQPVTLAHAQAVLRRVSETDVTLTALHAATTWSDRARQAPSYRQGRILLAGDAAHIHSPLGGQGLNLGIGDAMNLGWKLAAVIRRRARQSEDLLGSYHTERHPVGAQVLDWSRAQVAIMRPDPHARALHAVLRGLMATRDGATYMAGRVWGVEQRYDLGGAHPLAGRSVPAFEFEDGATVGRLMRDGKALLLDFEGNSAFASLAAEFGTALTYKAGAVRNRLGASAVLVRPDGIVAWAGGGESGRDADALRLAAARWLA